MGGGDREGGPRGGPVGGDHVAVPLPEVPHRRAPRRRGRGGGRGEGDGRVAAPTLHWLVEKSRYPRQTAAGATMGVHFQRGGKHGPQGGGGGVAAKAPTAFRNRPPLPTCPLPIAQPCHENIRRRWDLCSETRGRQMAFLPHLVKRSLESRPDNGASTF